jgi:glutaredoxin 3
MADLVSSLVAANRVMVFSKTYCPYCVKAKSALNSVGLSSFGLLELDSHPRADEVRSSARPRERWRASSFCARALRRRVAPVCARPPPRWRHRSPRTPLRRTARGAQVQDALLKLTGARSVPRVFVDGKCIGGGDDAAAMARDGRLKTMLTAAGIM